MPKQGASSASADSSPNTDVADISDYQQHQVLLSMPAAMYQQVTLLAQQRLNKASRNTETLSEPELSYVESQLALIRTGAMDKRLCIENAFQRKAQGKPVAKQFALKLHRVNRSSVVLHLIALGLKQTTNLVAHPEYTLDQALERSGLSYPDNKRTKTTK